VNNWKVIFATAVIFGAGVVTGGLLVNYVTYSHPKNTPRRPAALAAAHPATNQPPRLVDAAKPPRMPEILSRPFLQRLDEDLRLLPDQHEAVQKIINDGQNLMRKVIQDARLEIREVLTPQQRKQFDEMVKRPFHRPIFDTNATAVAESDYKARLEKIVAAQRASGDETGPAPTTSTVPPPVPRYAPATNAAPEVQVIVIEKERADVQADEPDDDPTD
jgi:uncharacterized membrane protein